MTALATDRDTRKKPGILGEGLVASAKKIYGGALVAFNAAGYITPGDDAANLIFAGVAKDRYDNSDGSNGDIKAVFEREGLHLVNLETALAQANIGDQVYLVDDQTVDLAANVTHNIFCGVLVELVTTTLGYIDITPAVKQTDVASHLADASGAHDASAIDIADTGGFTATTEVEAALQEIFAHVPALIADPGDGEAIPVTRAGTCALTTTEAGGETRTLAIPAKAGQRLSISLAVDGGDAVITAAAAINQAGNNTITLNDAGDYILLEGVKVGAGLVWRVTENDGCTLSTVG
jgi:hypothetical protein